VASSIPDIEEFCCGSEPVDRFLVWLYRTERTTIHTIVAAHTMTGELISALRDLTQNHMNLAAISGDHLSLSQTVDRYLELVELCTICYREGAHCWLREMEIYPNTLSYSSRCSHPVRSTSYLLCHIIPLGPCIIFWVYAWNDAVFCVLSRNADPL